jgi:hypothetical protein
MAQMSGAVKGKAGHILFFPFQKSQWDIRFLVWHKSITCSPQAVNGVLNTPKKTFERVTEQPC